MKSLKIFAAFTLLSGAIIQSSAWAHASLVSSTPAAGAEVIKAPANISLHFNEKPEVNFSSIKVLNVEGVDEIASKATAGKANAHELTANLKILKPGKYTVKWVAVGHDGHRRSGDYGFLVK